MYRTPEEMENEDVRLWTETIYQSASIFKGAPHEVSLNIWHQCGVDKAVGAVCEYVGQDSREVHESLMGVFVAHLLPSSGRNLLSFKVVAGVGN